MRALLVGRLPWIDAVGGLAVGAANVAWGAVCWRLLARHGRGATLLGTLELGLEGTDAPALGLTEWRLRREFAAG